MAAQQRLTADARDFYNNAGPGGGDDRHKALSLSNGFERSALTLTNHHYGLGSIPSGISVSSTQAEILDALHLLECQQVDELIDRMGSLGPGNICFDAGSGRGGTSLRLWERTKASVIGVTVAEDQAAYANQLVAKYSIPNVKFHVCNMLDAERQFATTKFDVVFANETDMYIVDLKELYTSFERMLVPGGRLVLSTWCCAAEYGRDNEFEESIDRNYGTKMHTEMDFYAAFCALPFTEVRAWDLSESAVPYWQLRNRWELRSGVEKPFLEGYARGAIKYMMFQAVKRPS